MNEDLFFAEDNGVYLANLMKSRQYLANSLILSTILDEVILGELELALEGVEKAKSEILKKTVAVTPLKEV